MKSSVTPPVMQSRERHDQTIPGVVVWTSIWGSEDEDEGPTAAAPSSISRRARRDLAVAARSAR